MWPIVEVFHDVRGPVVVLSHGHVAYSEDLRMLSCSYTVFGNRIALET